MYSCAPIQRVRPSICRGYLYVLHDTIVHLETPLRVEFLRVSDLLVSGCDHSRQTKIRL
jgi:hypothetical protein